MPLCVPAPSHAPFPYSSLPSPPLPSLQCFGRDELFPIAGRCFDWVSAGVTLVDAMDTLHVVGLSAEFQRARDWVADSMRLTQTAPASFFETTIRVLGGLLSAFDLSGDAAIKGRAVELGRKLLPALDTPSGLPVARVSLGAPSAAGAALGTTPLAEAGTIQLEFAMLSRLSGDRVFRDKAQAIIDKLEKAPQTHKG